MQGLILWTDFKRFTCERFWSMHLLMTSLVILRHYDTAIQLLSFVKHVGQFFADFDTSKFNASCLYVLKCAAFYDRHTSILSCCYCNCGCTFLLQHSHHRDLWKIKKYSWCWGLVEDLHPVCQRHALSSDLLMSTSVWNFFIVECVVDFPF